MKPEEIKKLFPFSITIPKDIDFSKSIGEQLLRLALPKELHEDIFWGLSIGTIGGVNIKTERTLPWQGKNVTIAQYLQKGEVDIDSIITFKLR